MSISQNLENKLPKVIKYILFPVFTIFYLYVAVQFLIYLFIVSINNSSYINSYFSWRFDLAILGMVTIGLFLINNVFFLFSKQNKFILPKIYFLIFVVVFNYFFNLKDDSYIFVGLLLFCILGLIDIATYIFYLVRKSKTNNQLIKPKLFSFKFFRPFFVAWTLSISILLPSFVFAFFYKPISSKYLVFTNNQNISNYRDYLAKFEPNKYNYIRESAPVLNKEGFNIDEYQKFIKKQEKLSLEKEKIKFYAYNPSNKKVEQVDIDNFKLLSTDIISNDRFKFEQKKSKNSKVEYFQTRGVYKTEISLQTSSNEDNKVTFIAWGEK